MGKADFCLTCSGTETGRLVAPGCGCGIGYYERNGFCMSKINKLFL